MNGYCHYDYKRGYHHCEHCTIDDTTHRQLFKPSVKFTCSNFKGLKVKVIGYRWTDDRIKSPKWCPSRKKVG